MDPGGRGRALAGSEGVSSGGGDATRWARMDHSDNDQDRFADHAQPLLPASLLLRMRPTTTNLTARLPNERRRPETNAVLPFNFPAGRKASPHRTAPRLRCHLLELVREVDAVVVARGNSTPDLTSNIPRRHRLQQSSCL